MSGTMKFAMLFGVLMFCPEADGGSLTWIEPPPIKTVQADGILVDHESRRQLHEGTINANLSWQFNLTDLKFNYLVLSFNRISLAFVRPWKQAVEPLFQNQFGIEWIANQTFVRLIIFNVTFEKHGAFTCRVHVKRKDSFNWQFESNVQVDVVAPPMVTLASKVYVGREQAASLICEVKGNPTPTISWSPCYGRMVICDEKYFNMSKVQMARANYTCTANNTVGVDSATTLLLIGGKNVYLRLSLAGECNSKDSVWMTLQKELGKVFSKTQGYSRAELRDVSVNRCESLIFDVVLKFGFRVAEDDTVSIIQSAIVDGKLGELSENVSFIIGIPPVKQVTTMAPTSTTPKSDGGASAPSTTEPTSAETGGSTSAPSTSGPTSAGTAGSAGLQWAISGGLAGGIVVLGIVVGVVSWWVHKRRKPRKDTTISNPDLELRHENKGRYLHVQCAQSGPPVANETDGAAEQEKEVVGVIPTYAVVDKSKKSKKRTDEKPPEFAIVNKSKIKEKQEAPTIPTSATTDESENFQEVPPSYAEEDRLMTKKKRDDKNNKETLDGPEKKKKSAVLRYVNMGDFWHPGMATGSISPQTLPAIKEADPYERMYYADITNFLKGNSTLLPNGGYGDGNETEISQQRQGSRMHLRLTSSSLNPRSP